MLELPESATICRQISETLADKTITSAVAASSPHGFAWYFGEPAMYGELLSGKRITGAKPRAGQVEIYAEDMRICLNDGVNVRFYAADAKKPDKHQLRVDFDDGSALICTVQMYGGLMAFPSGANENPYYLVATEKPSPLTDDFDEAYFGTMFEGAKKTLSAKAFLATEQRVPGLGNGVLQDILFRAGIHPKTKIGTFDAKTLHRLFSSVKETLAKMTHLGGRDTEKDLFGNPGGYNTVLSAKKLAYPCPVCGSGLVRQAYLGGNIYFCPNCQKA